MNRLLLLAGMTACAAWAVPTTYTFASSNYGTTVNFTSCTIGGCANFTSAMTISGSVTLANALPANSISGADISSQVTAYSFSDGLNTYTNTDPNTRIYQFAVNTDSLGQISIASLLIEKWKTGTSPHHVGDHVSFFNLNGSSINQADNNYSCVNVGGGTASGVSDLCVTANTDSNSSSASASSGSWTGGGVPTTGGPTVTPQPAAVPTPSLGEWGMIFLGGVLVTFGCLRLRRKPI